MWTGHEEEHRHRDTIVRSRDGGVGVPSSTTAEVATLLLAPGSRENAKINEFHPIQLTADEALEAQLVLPIDEWLDEHLSPTTWRLTGSHAGHGASKLDFLGAVENMETDWPYVVNHIKNLNDRQKQDLLMIDSRNSRNATSDSELSTEGIKRMCNSKLYKQEWHRTPFTKHRTPVRKNGFSNATFVHSNTNRPFNVQSCSSIEQNVYF